MLPPMLTRHLPYRWRSRIEADRHNRAVEEILYTPPIEPANDGVVLFSMMGTNVLNPYLVALKSFWMHLQRGRVVILDDGTLTANDKATLALHCGDPEIISIGSVVTDGFPKGGAWERLLTILDHRSDDYWIQLDSDTVTIGPVPEVEQAIQTNRSFTLLGGTDGEIGALPLADIAKGLYPEGPREGHIQARVESRMGEMRSDLGWRYIRGCAGFAGFAAGNPGRLLASAFLKEMTQIVGPDDISIWGTEQITSNFLIANETAPVLLPSARYLNYWGDDWDDDARFIHFVGTYRHDKGLYIEQSQRMISALQAGLTHART